MSDRSPRALSLHERDAQAVALVFALEEEDREARLIDLAERRGATAAARGRERAPSGIGWVARRAQLVVEPLARRYPYLRALLRWSRPARGLAGPSVVLAFLLGLATNALGPERRVHVLALPLLGIVAWNLVVVLLFAVHGWLPHARRDGPRAPRLRRVFEGLAGYVVRRWPPARSATDEGERQLLRRGMGRYLAVWLPAVGSLAAARTRRLLHAAALALAAGAVGGMYARGLLFEYRATWESTFLSPAAVDRLLGAVLAPAAAVLGRRVPAASPIESPASGPAALWIHLYAVTAGLAVGVPRMILLLAEGARCRRLAGRVVVRLPPAYLRRVEAAVETRAWAVEVVPYSHHLSAEGLEGLRDLLFELIGPRAELRLRPLAYGETEGEEATAAGLRVVVFGLAQTPEVEVHGALLARWRDAGSGPALLVVVDGSSYARQLGEKDAERRRGERRRAWNRVVDGGGLTAVHLDLELSPPRDAVDRLLAALWPAGALDAERR